MTTAITPEHLWDAQEKLAEMAAQLSAGSLRQYEGQQMSTAITPDHLQSWFAGTRIFANFSTEDGK